MKHDLKQQSRHRPTGHAAVTTDEVFKQFRQAPEMRDFVKKCYLDEDILEAARRFYVSEEFEAIRELARGHGFSRPGMVLDLGGGHGVASLAWQMAGHQVVLADPNRGDVTGLGAIRALVKNRTCSLTILAAIGEKIPCRDQAFDVVYGRQVLHHIHDLDAAAKEVYRVLVPGGAFLCTREHVISKPEDLEKFLDNHPTHRYTRDENARLVSDYTRALQKAGFRRVKVIGSWQSVVNYYPASKEDFISRCRLALARRFGAPISRYLAARQFLLPYYGWYMTKRDQTPGRMYSFLAAR
jgi:ubiquinone/menaquinone biosynthesis C-methylase UbiE